MMPLECTKIDGLDAEALLERTDQDTDLARMILLSFAESQRDSAARLPRLLETDLIAARACAHDLKSTLGNIGASALYQHAICLTERLRPSTHEDSYQLDDGTRQLARSLHTGVARLCADIEAALAQPSRPEPAATRPRASRTAIREHLAALARALEIGRARDAQRLIAELDAMALEAADRARLDRIVPLVRRYRLRDAFLLLTDDRDV